MHNNISCSIQITETRCLYGKEKTKVDEELKTNADMFNA